MPDDLEQIWKALADGTRRAILDLLRGGPRPTTEIVEEFSELSRFGVMKHMDVLRDAGLILTREQGRRRINSLNAVPIRMIYERWVSRYEGFWANTLLRVKENAEQTSRPKARSTSAKKRAPVSSGQKRRPLNHPQENSADQPRRRVARRIANSP